MNITAAWEMGYSGKGVVVSILDDGIEMKHPDLAQNYDKEASWDVNSDDDDPTPHYNSRNDKLQIQADSSYTTGNDNNSFVLSAGLRTGCPRLTRSLAARHHRRHGMSPTCGMSQAHRADLLIKINKFFPFSRIICRRFRKIKI